MFIEWRGSCVREGVACFFSAEARHLILIAFLLLAGACTQKSSPSSTAPSSVASSSPNGGHTSNNGGYDWGGGGSLKSSPTLVRRTIEMAQGIAGEPDPEQNVFKHFYLYFVVSLAGKHSADFNYLFPNRHAAEVGDRYISTASPALEAIAKAKIRLLEKGNCPSEHGEKSADASVSKHTLDGEVCFSVGNLTNIATSDLTRQVMGLILHEAVHLAGGNEAQAVAHQQLFDMYFGTRFGEMNPQAYLDEIGRKIDANIKEIGKLSFLVSASTDISLVYARMGLIYGAFESLHGIDDPGALRLRLLLKKSDGVTEFVRRLDALMRFIDNELSLDRNPKFPRNKTYEDLSASVKYLEEKGEGLSLSWKALEREGLCDVSDQRLSTPRTKRLQKICAGFAN